MSKSIEQRVIEHSERCLGVPPAFVIGAAGRVNLMGEHIGYNDGFVLPMAIYRAIWMALQPCQAPFGDVHFLDFDEAQRLSLDDLTTASQVWSNTHGNVAPDDAFPAL